MSAPLVLLSTAGIGITAVAADLIAVRLRSAALAGLPLLILFTVPATMNAQHEGVGTAVVFCLAAAGYLAMLSADGRDRIRVWGRLVSLWRSGSQSGTAARAAASRRIASREAGPDTRALAAAGRRVGLASVVLAHMRAADRPGPAPEQAVFLGSGHRRQGQRQRCGRDRPSGHAPGHSAPAPGHPAGHDADVYHQRSRRS